MGIYQTRQFPLTSEGIDRAADLVGEELKKLGLDSRDALRNRLSVEEVLLAWQPEAGLEDRFTVELGRRFGRATLAVRCAGLPRDPLAAGEDAEGPAELSRQLLSTLGLGLAYHYRDGENVVSCTQKVKRRLSQLTLVLLALCGALLLGALGLLLPEGLRASLLTNVLDPLFSTFLGIFSCIVGPMMFISMVWGIVNMGDTRQLGLVGRKLLTRFLLYAFLFAALALCAALFWFRPTVTGGGAGGSVLQSVVEMVLDIVPKNIVDPFQSGNTLQILFLGAVVGVGMILLRDQMQVMNSVVEQSNSIVQLVLSAIGGMVPAFIFLSVLRLVLKGELAANAAGLAKMLCLTLILLCVNVGFHVLSLFKEGVKPLAAFKKLLPTALVALSTGSSAAAFPSNLDCCENKLGISPKLTRFAIPFGSVAFMPQIAMTMVYVPLFAASLYGVELSTGSLVLCAVNAVVLSVAAPPIPGGAIACYTLMFLQLGIPLEAISIAATANVVLDFTDTCGNLLGLQVQLVHGAKSMGMLDKEILKG